MIQDLRFAARRLARSPGFALTAVATLAVTLGANTTMFSVAYAVLWQPLPLSDANRLVVVTDATRAWGLTEPEYLAFRERSTTLEVLAAYGMTEANLVSDGTSSRALVAATTADLFAVLDAQTIHGRTFGVEEDAPGGAAVAVLSEAFWRKSFGADSALVGRQTLRLDGQPYTVVGVLSEQARFPLPRGADVFLPLQLDPADPEPQVRYLRTLGKTIPGATSRAVSREMRHLNEALIVENEQRFPEGFNRTERAQAVSYRDDLVADAGLQLWLLIGAVGLLLLIACGNIAGLLAIRADVRAKEIAVQRALGAGRLRIASSVLAEAVLLSSAGGALGVLLTLRVLPAIDGIIPPEVPFASGARVNLPVVLFSSVLVLVAALLSSVLPSLRSSGATLTRALNEGGRSDPGGTSWTRGPQATIALQLGLAVMLVIGASLLSTSLERLQRVDPGFEPRGAVTVSVSLPRDTYPGASNVSTFINRFQERTVASAEVEAAGATTNLPLLGGTSNVTFGIEGRPPGPSGEIVMADFEIVSAGYFPSMEIGLERGRLFQDTDRDDSLPAVIVNEAAVRRYWTHAPAVGTRIRLTEGLPWMVVVGVVSDVPSTRMSAPVQPRMYLPVSQSSYSSWLGVGRSLDLVVRSRQAAPVTLSLLQSIVGEIDPGLSLSEARELEAIVAESIATERFLRALMGSFAGIALALAWIGIHGAVGYSVQKRRHEFGVRLALGATPPALIRLVLRGMARPVGTGLALGVVGAVVSGRLLGSLLYQVDPRDPLTLLAVTFALGGAATLACYLPARRAGRADPREVLGAE